MEIEIELNESIEENAGTYFELAKKAKRKLEGAKKALAESKRKLGLLQKEESSFMEKEIQKLEKKERKREWYEKFHWFISSEGFLCIGGKDATSNELVIKKHTAKEDLVLHTDLAGSPFFVIKNGQQAGEETITEASQAVAVHSRAWKLGHTTADVFYVKPEQVSKEANPGEYIGKGSFMIRGKTNYLYPKLEYAVGLVGKEAGKEIEGGIRTEIEEKIIGGPVKAVESRTKNYVVVIQGKESKSELAKKIKHKLKGGDLDEIIKFLPAGGGEIKK